MLEVKNLSCGYGKKNILEHVSFKARQGDIVCILGANGSGKSTLIKTIVGLIPDYEGGIFIDGIDIRPWSWAKRARTISYIPQSFSSSFQYKGLDIVLMGRTSYIGLSIAPSKKDIKLAEESMEKLNILHLKDKVYCQMSGGERQLVKIAQALAQESKIILMDEATNNLDFGNQTTILNHLKACSDLGMIIIMATHFPDQALLYGKKALLIKDKALRQVNQPSIELTEKQIEDLYNIRIKLIELEIENKKRKICVNLI